MTIAPGPCGSSQGPLEAQSRRGGTSLLLALVLAMIPGAAAAQEIPRDEYLTMLPLSVPRLGPQTEASVELRLFGDPAAPGYPGGCLSPACRRPSRSCTRTSAGSGVL